MTTAEKANFVTAVRTKVSEVVKGVHDLQASADNATANGGIATVFTDYVFSGSDTDITTAMLTNFISTNLPALNAALFTGSGGANATNTYALAKIAEYL